MLPPTGNLLIELLKNTALVSLITITDLTFRGQLLRSETLRTTEIFTLVLLLYFAVALVITGGIRMLERRFKVR
ncbi:binding-protein-dependent transport system inner membrane protein [Bordetella pertussis]|nr:binding-protein-dependent transport system inner membrane protein [Bordetella pertussis]CFO78441.1 binding-protein-dependent transport system inner membrane protein [Bordetella pertussis]CFP68324.1 binding-protein-dependent transport system inner membrane protein [Bordetella pertussis]CFU90426.1 binding-protein-dependent transport system inner membrane protein [Bordetella pertussis]CPI72292.1 binding-protein-dependent transport system inner membrane protein [Bordetella pertussis]